MWKVYVETLLDLMVCADYLCITCYKSTIPTHSLVTPRNALPSLQLPSADYLQRHSDNVGTFLRQLAFAQASTVLITIENTYNNQIQW